MEAASSGRLPSCTELPHPLGPESLRRAGLRGVAVGVLSCVGLLLWSAMPAMMTATDAAVRLAGTAGLGAAYALVEGHLLRRGSPWQDRRAWLVAVAVLYAIECGQILWPGYLDAVFEGKRPDEALVQQSAQLFSGRFSAWRFALSGLLTGVGVMEARLRGWSAWRQLVLALAIMSVCGVALSGLSFLAIYFELPLYSAALVAWHLAWVWGHRVGDRWADCWGYLPRTRAEVAALAASPAEGSSEPGAGPEAPGPVLP